MAINPILSTGPLAGRRRSSATRCRAVAEYTSLWGWIVALDGLRLGPGSGPAEVRAAWLSRPQAQVRLLTGHGFDVLTVPEQAGYQALVRAERMGLRPGPVLAAEGSAHFFVTEGTAGDLPKLLYRAGWDGAELDLTGRGLGASVPVPPSPTARWLRPPTPDSALHPPEPQPLLSALAYSAHTRPRALLLAGQ